MRRDHEFGNGGGVAQSEIEPLGADRRDDVRGLANQLRPGTGDVVPLALRAETSPRPGSTVTLPRIEWERRSISCRHLGIGQPGEPWRVLRIGHKDQAGTPAGQRHQRERAGFSV